MELLKLITCYKPRRAREAAAAARFFDDDARNLYGAYLRKIKRKYAPHVPEACLTAAREISGVRAKKIPQMRGRVVKHSVKFFEKFCLYA